MMVWVAWIRDWKTEILGFLGAWECFGEIRDVKWLGTEGDEGYRVGNASLTKLSELSTLNLFTLSLVFLLDLLKRLTLLQSLPHSISQSQIFTTFFFSLFITLNFFSKIIFLPLYSFTHRFLFTLFFWNHSILFLTKTSLSLSFKNQISREEWLYLTCSSWWR